jgi:hypothetical protein
MAMVPEILVDGFGDIAFKEGLIRIELISLSDSAPEVRQRLIMTIPAFLHAVQAQQNMVAKFEEVGVIRARRTTPSAPGTVPAPLEAETPAAGPAPERAAAMPKSPNFPVD